MLTGLFSSKIIYSESFKSNYCILTSSNLTKFNQGFCRQALEGVRCFATAGRAIGLLELCQQAEGEDIH